jgi:hypothetical protein
MYTILYICVYDIYILYIWYMYILYIYIWYMYILYIHMIYVYIIIIIIIITIIITIIIIIIIISVIYISYDIYIFTWYVQYGILWYFNLKEYMRFVHGYMVIGWLAGQDQAASWWCSQGVPCPAPWIVRATPRGPRGRRGKRQLSWLISGWKFFLKTSVSYHCWLYARRRPVRFVCWFVNPIN